MFGFYSKGMKTKYIVKDKNKTHKATIMRQIDHNTSVHTMGIQKS